MRYFYPVILACAFTLLGTGCGLFRKKPKPQPPASPRVVIGKVEMVNPELKFALIHSIDRAAVPEGASLVTANEMGETAQLKMSPERKGVFMTADIVSGQPSKGEAVIWIRAETPAAATTAPIPEVVPSATITIPSPSLPQEAPAAPSIIVTPPAAAP